MVAAVHTVAFQGIEARLVTVEVHISSGLPAFTVVGLADKAVSEARERIRAALSAIGLSLPAERITVNLSPADMPKEGSHYDLPIALGLLSAMGALSPDLLTPYIAMGELGLDGRLRAVSGALPAALKAVSLHMGLICPADVGGEAAWAGEIEIVAAPHLMALIAHLRGGQLLASPEMKIAEVEGPLLDLKDIKGQESAKRALEVAAAGGHNLLMIGPPGAGKSMLAARLPSLLPDMSAEEILEISMIKSLSGHLEGGAISNRRPFRAPHHSASQPALIGGGSKAKPGEVSLAHSGVLFLDELPEFSRQSLEALRQPMETGRAVIARAEAHVTYPARFQLIAAMNPCRCGYLSDPALACSRAPRCGSDYQSKISGPLYDRFDLVIEVEAVSAMDLSLPRAKEGSSEVAARIKAARMIQQARFAAHDKADPQAVKIRSNAEADGSFLEAITPLSASSRDLLQKAVEHMRLSARGYHRVLRVARTLADLQASEAILDQHIAEALSYRRLSLQALQQAG